MLTQEDIDAVRDAVVGQLRQEFGGNFRQETEDKDKDALKEIFSDTDQRGVDFRAAFEDFLQKTMVRLWQASNPDPDARAFQARFDQDVRDRAYEADVAYGGRHAQGSAEALDAAMKQRNEAIDKKEGE